MLKTKRKLRKLPKNKVVCYKGGGYDGCYWEYNFAYVDKDGNFHDIFSSGYKAITNGKDLLEELNNEKADGLDVYDMNDKDDRQRMTTAESVFNAMRVADFFADHTEFEVDIKLQCSCCEKWVKPEACHAEGIHGCGGIMLAANDIICPECHSSHSCWHCGEYDSDELVNSITKDDGTTIELNGPACQWCASDFKDGRRNPE